MRDSGMVIDWSHMILMARYVDKLYWWCWWRYFSWYLAYGGGMAVRFGDLWSWLRPHWRYLDKLESIPGYNITPTNEVFG